MLGIAWVYLIFFATFAYKLNTRDAEIHIFWQR